MNRVRSEAPIKRVVNGKTRWIARYTNPVTGKREVAKPVWNRSKGTFDLKKDAQRAIDEAYGTAFQAATFGSYFDGTGNRDGWLDRHPRAERTEKSYATKFRAVRGLVIEGVALEDWQIGAFRRRQANTLVSLLLTRQGRARKGALGVIRVLSALSEDAITDEVSDHNGFQKIKIRADDKRIKKPARKPQVFSWTEMHDFAAKAPKDSELLILTLSDCGLRIGEALPLECDAFDPTKRELLIHQTTFEGSITQGLKGKRDDDKDSFTRRVPVHAELAERLEARATERGEGLLFSTPSGKLWRYRNFIRDVWQPTIDREDISISPTPHDFRHSFVTHMRAAGINDEDLAEITGHNVLTMIDYYSHPLRRSFDQVRKAVG